MCDSNVQLFADTGVVNISTANPNLNGTGAMGTLVTATNNGTTINSIIVKSTGTTTQGMVRLFVNTGSQIFLIKEVMVPGNIQTGVVQAYSILLDEPIVLQAGYSLMASTQNSESFNVVASGQSWLNCACS